MKCDMGFSFLQRYQPKRFAETFDGMDGLPNRFLTQAISRRSLPRLIALTGPAGTGKGTTARIIARRHCCENKDAHPFEPCVKCDGCRSIGQCSGSTFGSDWGYTELDATRMPGDKILDIIEDQGRFNSIEGRNRHLFYVDELTRQRTGVQERLLRYSENTPCRIILGTIDPASLLPELLDRFVHLQLTFPTEQQVVQGLERIARSEGARLRRQAARLIAVATQNNPRRAVKTLGVAITLASDGVMDTSLVEMALSLGMGTSVAGVREATGSGRLARSEKRE